MQAPVSPQKIANIDDEGQQIVVIESPQGAFSPVGANRTFGTSMHVAANVTPDMIVDDSALAVAKQPSQYEDLQSLGERQSRSYTYTAKSSNRKVTYTTPKGSSAVGSSQLNEEAYIIDAQVIEDEPPNEEELLQASRTRKIIACITLLGVLIGIIVLIVFVTNAGKENAPTGVDEIVLRPELMEGVGAAAFEEVLAGGG